MSKAIDVTKDELRDLCKQQRELKWDMGHRKLVLATKRLPVRRRMAAMAQEMGVEPVEGETLAEFCERATVRP